LLVAAVFRTWLILIDGVSFESDEAVVGLMARHINQGKPIPTFFYGQAYMGSLDALLVAGGFRILGESVDTIRVTQMVLYRLSLMTGYELSYSVTRNRRVASMTLLLLAVPTAVGALYTTASLGGYNELVLLGNLVLLLGWQVTVRERREIWRWTLLGLAAGLGWWSNGAIITAILTVGLIGLRYFSTRNLRGYALAATGFFIGSAPWWVYNLHHDWAALEFLTGGFQTSRGAEAFTPGESVIALLVLGLPTLYGLRFPWEPGFGLSAGTAAGAVVYLILIVDGVAGSYVRLVSQNIHLARDTTQEAAGKSMLSPHRLVWLIFGVFATVFILSSFADATGRYLMPVWVPAAIGVALGLERLWRAGWVIAALLLGVLLTMQGGTVIRATQTGTGLTPQLVERLRTPAADDNDLLAFLNEEGYLHGYAGYWTSYRVMFRAHEAVIFDTSLPYDRRGTNPSHNRYSPYPEQVGQAEKIVWVTQNYPELDALIDTRLKAIHMTFRVRDIGHYRVYYDLSRNVTPASVGLTLPDPLDQ